MSWCFSFREWEGKEIPYKMPLFKDVDSLLSYIHGHGIEMMPVTIYKVNKKGECVRKYGKEESQRLIKLNKLK
jgi:hypothetical protein